MVPSASQKSSVAQTEEWPHVVTTQWNNVHIAWIAGLLISFVSIPVAHYTAQAEAERLVPGLSFFGSECIGLVLFGILLDMRGRASCCRIALRFFVLTLFLAVGSLTLNNVPILPYNRGLEFARPLLYGEEVFARSPEHFVRDSVQESPLSLMEMATVPATLGTRDPLRFSRGQRKQGNPLGAEKMLARVMEGPGVEQDVAGVVPAVVSSTFPPENTSGSSVSPDPVHPPDGKNETLYAYTICMGLLGLTSGGLQVVTTVLMAESVHAGARLVALGSLVIAQDIARVLCKLVSLGLLAFWPRTASASPQSVLGTLLAVALFAACVFWSLMTYCFEVTETLPYAQYRRFPLCQSVAPYLAGRKSTAPFSSVTSASAHGAKRLSRSPHREQDDTCSNSSATAFLDEDEGPHDAQRTANDTTLRAALLPKNSGLSRDHGVRWATDPSSFHPQTTQAPTETSGAPLPFEGTLSVGVAKHYRLCVRHWRVFCWDICGIALPWFLFGMVSYGNGLSHFLLIQPQGKEAGGSAQNETLFELVVSLVCLGGTTGAVFLLGRIKPKLLQILGFVVMSFVYFGLSLSLFSVPRALASNVDQGLSKYLGASLLYDSVYRLSNSIPNVTCRIIPVDAFPTKVRGTFLGFCAGLFRVGGVIGIILAHRVSHVYVSRASALALYSLLLLLGAVVTRALTPQVLPSQGELLRLDVKYSLRFGSYYGHYRFNSKQGRPKRSSDFLNHVPGVGRGDYFGARMSIPRRPLGAGSSGGKREPYIGRPKSLEPSSSDAQVLSCGTQPRIVEAHVSGHQ